MRAEGICPASCGELVQGLVGETEYLTSYAIDLFSRVKLLEEKELFNSNTYKSRMALKKVFERFSLDINDTKNIKIEIDSNIPLAKGMASSTADIGATISAALAMINKKLSCEEIAKLAAEIEPTDSTLIRENCIFNPTRGDIKSYIGTLDGCKVLVLEPEEILLTTQTRASADYYINKENNRTKTEEAFRLLQSGFEDKDLYSIGKACNISALANESIHSKIHLEKIVDIACRHGAYGVNVAHSGTVIGVLMDEDFDEDIVIKELIRNDISSVYKKIYLQNIITGGSRGDKNGIYKESYENRR